MSQSGVVSGGGGGGGGGAWTFIEAITAAASADIRFLTGIDSTFNNYVVLLRSIVPVTDDVNFFMDVSTDGGSTWLNTGYNSWALIVSAAGNGETSNATTFQLNFDQNTNRLDNVAGEGYTAQLIIQNLTSGGTPYMAGYGGYKRSSGGGSYLGVTATGRGPTSITVDALRFRMSSGNISTGEFLLYGISE